MNRRIYSGLLIALLVSLFASLYLSEAVQAATAQNKAEPSLSQLGSTAGACLAIAHRGASDAAPDNTAAAFRKAGKAGFWGAEADVRPTKNGVLVCLHNQTADAMTNGRGYVYSKKWSAVKKYRIDAGRNWRKYDPQHICTFSEFLDICKRFHMVAVIDIKVPSEKIVHSKFSEKAVRNMYKMVRKKKMLDQAVFQCSVHEYLKYVKQESDKAVKEDSTLPKATTWYLAQRISRKEIRTAKKLGCAGITSTFGVTRSMIAYAHKKRVRVMYYLVTSNAQAKKYRRYKADFLVANRKFSAMFGRKK